MLTLPSSAPVTKKDADASKRTAQQVTGARWALGIAQRRSPVTASWHLEEGAMGYFLKRYEPDRDD